MSSRKGETHEQYLARRRKTARSPEYKAKASERSRRWRLENPERVKQNNKLNYLKSPGARGRLKSTYGITPAQYDEMLARQNGLCAACGGEQRTGRPLCVDHCHKTKVVRGLLCDACNICAGHIESHRFERVTAYLARQQRPGWTVWGNQTDKFKAAQ